MELHSKSVLFTWSSLSEHSSFALHFIGQQIWEVHAAIPAVLHCYVSVELLQGHVSVWGKLTEVTK